MKAGTRVRISRTNVNHMDTDHWKEFSQSVGVVVTEINDIQQVDVRWEPYGLRHAYHVEELQETHERRTIHAWRSRGEWQARRANRYTRYIKEDHNRREGPNHTIPAGIGFPCPAFLTLPKIGIRPPRKFPSWNPTQAGT